MNDLRAALQDKLFYIVRLVQFASIIKWFPQERILKLIHSVMNLNNDSEIAGDVLFQYKS